jgi:hypothetical protein
MPRRPSQYELEAAQYLLLEAREYLDELFPKLSGVHLGVHREYGSVAVRARVADTAPYPRVDILDSLEQLGVPVAPIEGI